MTTAKRTAAKVAAKLTPIKIGPAIDELYSLREKKRKLEEQIKIIEAEYSGIEEQLMEKLAAEGTDTGKGSKASASITYNVVGNVTDWDTFCAFCAKNKFYHLLYRRVSDPGVRELFEQGKKVPGCEPFTKKRLNVRSGV